MVSSAVIKEPRVLLLSMPWTTLTEPSLGLAILKARLREEGIAATVCHLNIFLLRYMKASSYERIADLYAFDDFLFTRALQGEMVADDQIDALRRMALGGESRQVAEAAGILSPSSYLSYALRVRNDVVPRFLADCMRVVESSGATMVGFTCLFDQTIPSLALAQHIKERYPEMLVVFGGYAIERPVGAELLRSFSCVDVVAAGEGEDRIVALARASVDRSLLPEIPDLLWRDQSGRVRRTPPTRQRVDLNSSPIPDYDDWFADLRRLDTESQVCITTHTLPVESSRGCWWGEVSHCVFCGIDDKDMHYTSKSPEVVRQMLDSLHQRYGCAHFRFSDYILPRSYYKTLLPMLAAAGAPYSLHWEMKSNVRLEDVRLMQRAGIRYIQPGIESFSSSVLRKMSKGVTAIQNVLTIKLLMEHDIQALYNILYGFPTDELEKYQEMCALIPSLHHLRPTSTCMPVLTVRYAPMAADPQRFQIQEPTRAKQRYDMIFSRQYRAETGFDPNNYAYIFETPYDLDPALQPQYDRLRYLVDRWYSLYHSGKARLQYRVVEDGIEFVDSRVGEPVMRRFSLDHAQVYCSITQQIELRRTLPSRFSDLPAERIGAVLDDLAGERLIMEDGGKVLGLALPASWYQERAAKA